MAVGYAVIRFFLTFYRQEVVSLWGLQEAQVIALVTGVLALGVLSGVRWPRAAAARPERGPTAVELSSGAGQDKNG